ncbi:hypothetical protein [Actinokineospora bangkokensis]|uniref:Uncharacterized protein n=1 Tax=Actinokineospora bangkokensis TaxID=1193682 RepID=A0A1Q9LDV6_9PSEU|nr:hypothetical protein [Actinokineospora bangkokensis]OLR90227.1 hypothetical protein BJP25_04535 [Actinokineospora bangkokensis]
MSTRLGGTCAECSADRAAAPALDALTWVPTTEGGRTTWLCPPCARAHVRDIEGKLPPEHWAGRST